MTAPRSGPPVIPAPPPRIGGPRKRSAPKSKTPLIGGIALVVGAILGALGYEWVPGITVSFDYVLTVLLG